MVSEQRSEPRSVRLHPQPDLFTLLNQEETGRESEDLCLGCSHFLELFPPPDYILLTLQVMVRRGLLQEALLAFPLDREARSRCYGEPLPGETRRGKHRAQARGLCFVPGARSAGSQRSACGIASSGRPGLGAERPEIHQPWSPPSAASREQHMRRHRDGAPTAGKGRMPAPPSCSGTSGLAHLSQTASSVRVEAALLGERQEEKHVGHFPTGPPPLLQPEKFRFEQLA
ncbi:uncharacterized protein LOC122201002 [Panthera leo]|uniref:uncharacterized protein LOC122201002 n=1 Tax=Panthera leo TaxID=9689 RepID=UPI001C69CD57|nr:uncharacterized protein LOC122201002 [Panthera leo]